MTRVFLISTFVFAIFAAALICMTSPKQFRNRLISTCAAISVIIGVCFYGYCFSIIDESFGAAVFHALLAVCKMFVGRNEVATIQSTPVYQNSIGMTIFWLGHFLAFFVTAGATVAVIGNALFRRIRATLFRGRKLLLIYGTNDAALAYGRRMIAEKKHAVMYVDDEGDMALDATLSAVGTFADCSQEAIAPDARFLKRIGVLRSGRQADFALLQEDPLKNLVYAQKLLDALSAAGITPDQTTLLLRGVEENDAGYLMNSEAQYGFGDVYAFNEYSLTARMMIRQYPPCNVLSFDAKGAAQGDFTAAIIGFGPMGMAVLDQLVMNGQFAGSRFSVDVFDDTDRGGLLRSMQTGRVYDIGFHACGADQDELYKQLEAKRYPYIVLCQDTPAQNLALANKLRKWYRGRPDQPLVLQCTGEGLIGMRGDRYDLQYRFIYASDALNLWQNDADAMVLNQYYCKGNGHSMAENWHACDYFSRMSNRAAADFVPSHLHAIGKTAADVAASGLGIDDETLENMAYTEHLRWNAFHYVMGYQVMTADEVRERAAANERNSGTKLRLNKDTATCRHACLVPWEELDAVSELENRLNGTHKDYKQADRDNILAIPELLAHKES